MAYSITYGKSTVEISGFLVSLPFTFDGNKNMQLCPDNAFACVQLTSARFETVNFGKYSSTFPDNDTFEFKDENKNKRIQLHDFVPARIISSQSTDIGESLWILGGNASDKCKIVFDGGINSSFENFKGQAFKHCYWAGELKEGKKVLLNLSHAGFDLNATEHYISEMMAFGPSGYDNTCGIMKWIIEKGLWMQNKIRQGNTILDKLGLNDLRRNTTLFFFGNDNAGKAQISNAYGSVFLFQGVFSRLLPDTLFHMIKITASNIQGNTPTLQNSPELKTLRTVIQPCCKTVKDCVKEDIDNTVFEGICLWELKKRDQETASPVFL